MKETKYILGIDWGKKRCGIAFADTETLIASGFGECKQEDLITRVNEIAEKMEIQEIVIGFSYITQNDQQNESIQKAANQLSKEGYSVIKEEETFSTKMAQRHLIEAEKKQVSQNDNVESARIILQGWLDKNM